ncbi:Hypothetical predicted protein, partial [Podarcis lilfordi]
EGVKHREKSTEFPIRALKSDHTTGSHPPETERRGTDFRNEKGGFLTLLRFSNLHLYKFKTGFGPYLAPLSQT